MLFSLKCLWLLWLVNLAPPLLAHVLDDRWNRPVDGHRPFFDGKPIFGPHKTIRGIGVALATGAGIAHGFGMSWSVGLGAAALSMGGDLLSSFLKRRLDLPSGSAVPIVDQLFEGAFPFIVLSPYGQIGIAETSILIILFIIGAYTGSYFLKEILLKKPFDSYPRHVKSRVRFREFKSCQVRSKPWLHVFHFEDVLTYRIIMNSVFRWLRIYDQGRANALKIKKTRITFHFEDLPDAFHGYKILLMTDLHLDGLDGLKEKIIENISAEEVDLCLLGGDYRMENYGPSDEAVARLRELLPKIPSRDGTLAVLGNHDCPEMIDALHESPVRFLFNEAHCVHRGSDRLWIIGVDDPHYFQCHDLETPVSSLPPDAFSILLVHSPELAGEASRLGIRLYLCGHTHAGQIQLPFVGPVFTHSRSPKRIAQGSWRWGRMLGYTSAGVGVSGSPVRFNTQGEVVYITLKKGKPQSRSPELSD